ncbi:RNA 2',3'-cyclic phosphodiesterase [Magnetococcales bacterium HHB-1]
MMRRLFVACTLPETVREALYETLTPLRRAFPEVKWSDASQYHLTLRFLGRQPEDRLPEIFARLQDLVRDMKPFSMQLSNWGGFPSVDRARVLWIGVKTSEVSQPAALASVLQRLPSERKEDHAFHPHITVGRIRRRDPMMKARWFQDLSWPQTSWSVDKIVLFESQLSAQGASYHRLLELTYGQ